MYDNLNYGVNQILANRYDHHACPNINLLLSFHGIICSGCVGNENSREQEGKYHHRQESP